MSSEVALTATGGTSNWRERLEAHAALVLAYLALRCLNLFTIAEIVRFLKRRCKRDLTLNEANHIWRALRRARLSHLGREACLEMSLAVVLIACAKRSSVTWCVGVSIAPFTAHAWIEVEGVSISEEQQTSNEPLQTLLVL